MTISGAVKTLVPTGSAVLAQQVIEPLSMNVFERLGTVSIVAIGSYYLVKYFMGQIDKKDQQNRELQAAYIETMKHLHTKHEDVTEANTALLVSELRESRTGRERLTDTLAALIRSNEQLAREVMTAKKSAP